MKYLSLDFIKQHSRIDFDNDDGLLELYGDSAEETIATFLNRGTTVDECVASLTEQYGRIPANIFLAAQMLVDVSYQYRSPINPTNMSHVPYTFDMLIKPYMKL